MEPRGSLLFQAGRADFIEKYIEIYDHWRRAGWTIEGFDWRGQGGSGRVLADGRLGHGPPYDVMVNDLAAFVEEWRERSPGPHVALGHSMGGHLLLRLLAERAPAMDGAVLLSPMLGLNTGLPWQGLGRLIARILCGIGMAERGAWSEDSAKGSGHRQRNLTHSAERYEDEQWWRRSDPMLDVGPPTWGWLRDSWQSIADLLAPGVLEKVHTPMLILCAEQDRLVMTGAVRRAADRLPSARLLCKSGAAHELLREADPARLWALSEIDQFLESIVAA
jgi:lysophospholipase